MCGTNRDHDHDHDGGHQCCSYGEGYERNLAEQRALGLTRRDLLAGMGAAGLLIANGAINAGSVAAASTGDATRGAVSTAQPYAPQAAGDFGGYFFLSGDHHIHTRFSPDGKYAVQRQVAEANYHRLNWMVITDHGGAAHNQISVDLTYPDIQRARDAFQNMLVFVGLEMNIPGGEHGTVMVQPTAAEKDQIKAFEAAYDGAIVSNTEAKALEGLRWLDQQTPKPLFFANHPSRRGLDSPHEIRNWKSAAPEVAYGFEGAPGHQAAGLLRDAAGKITSYRGFYGNKPSSSSWPGYPAESYFTYGGFDWMTAKLGGLWDSLLGDGLRWWITANSDAHKYFSDLQDVDRSAFTTTGFVTEADRYFLRPSYGDFRPGEYGRTYVATTDPSYAGIMAGLRAGNMFVVHGDLIDRLTFTASAKAPGASADMVTTSTGGTLEVAAGSEVFVEIKVRVPAARNFNNDRPMVDHVDLIAGDITNLSQTAGLDTMVNPTTRVVTTYKAGMWKQEAGRDADGSEGMVLTMRHTFPYVQRDFYIRLRGTNTDDRTPTPAMDPDRRGLTGPAESPWDDLWFYSNPIFVRVRR